MSGQRVVAIGRVAVSNRGVLTPTQLPGLFLWLDASDASSFTLSGANVTVWGDKSGLHNDAGSFVGTRPTRVANVLNGKAGVSFAVGTDAVSTTVLSVGTFTIFSVFSATTNTMIYQQNTSGNGFWLYGDTNASMLVSTGAGSSQKDVGSSWVVTGSPLYVTHSFDGTHAGHLLRKNGAAPSLTNVSSQNPGSAGTAASIYFGRSNGSALGYHFEHIFYNRVLSASEISAIEGYLRSKWGL